MSAQKQNKTKTMNSSEFHDWKSYPTNAFRFIECNTILVAVIQLENDAEIFSKLHV